MKPEHADRPSPPGRADAPRVLRFGPFRLDLVAGRLTREGHTVELAPRPWSLLTVLAQHPGELLTKDQLLDAVWGHRFVSESSLKVAINTLRVALGEDSSAPHWVLTVPRRGYRFSEAVEHGEPAAPKGGSAGNLPAAGIELIGREASALALSEAMALHRVVTLVGPGGVGKTSLALRATAASSAPDGCWLVRLETLRDPQAVPAAVARALNLSESDGRSAATLARALAPLDLRLLLDNAEHLADAVAQTIAACVAAAPGLRVLVTSQRALRLTAEHVLQLAPLPVPEADASTEDAAQSTAVQLLIQRVRAQQPDWVPQAAELTHAGAITRAVEGMPLALELAAARVPMLGLKGVRDRLDQRFKLLTRGASDAPMRHRTLQAALDWTVGLLSEQAARALGHLSVFSGSFSLDAAQSLVQALHPDQDEWDILEALQQLRDFGLVVSAEGFHSGVPRVRMFESVRLFAAQGLDATGLRAATDAALREQLTRRFQAQLALAEHLGADAWLAPQMPDADDLRAVMGRGLEQLNACFDGDLFGGLFDLAAASVLFCCRGGMAQASGRWLAALDAARATQDAGLSTPRETERDVYVATLCAMGQAYDLAQAVQAGERLLRMAEVGRPAEPALFVLFCLGRNAHRASDLEQCQRVLACHVRLQPARPSRYQRRFPIWLDVMLARSRGDLEPAETYWAAQWKESIEVGDRAESWISAMGVAQSYYLRGRVDEAIGALDQAVDEMRAVGRLRTNGGIVAQATALRLTRDLSQQTVLRLHEALQILRSSGMVWWMADALSWVPLWQGRIDESRRIQAWADALVEQRGEARGPVFSRVRAAWQERVSAAPLPSEPALNEATVLEWLRAAISQD